MKTLSITKWLLLFMCVFSISVQSQWIKKTFPGNEYLNIVRFASPELGWIVSDNHIYKTTNGGSDWSIIDTVYSIWKGFHVIDDTTLLVGDYKRGIRLSENGGESWYTVDSTIQNVNSFMFLNKKLGYASGGYGDTADVYQTTDGGTSWKRITHKYIENDWVSYSDFSKVSFIDSLQGWAVAYGGMIFNTTDGGLNWNFQDSTAKTNLCPLRDIQFTTADSGWAVGGMNGSILLRTADGGENWTSWITSSNPPDISIANFQEIFMLNSKVGWITGSGLGPAYILKTTDGGETWIDETPQNEYFGFQSISMIDNLHGFIVGGTGALYETVNGGEVTDVNRISLVEKFFLNQNYPNPFNPTTKIQYSIPQSSEVSIKIYDTMGREIKTLLNENKTPGNYEIEFDGSGLSSGVYFYRIEAGSYYDTKKMLLLK